MLKFYYLCNNRGCTDEEYYFLVGGGTLVFPYKRTSASALQYVEYYLDHKNKFHGDLQFIDIFPNPNFKKRGEFVKIKNKFFIMLDEGNVYV